MPFILQPRFKQGPHNPICLIVKKKKFAGARPRQLAYRWLSRETDWETLGVGFKAKVGHEGISQRVSHLNAEKFPGEGTSIA